jgi:2-oxoisovalerate dehydrogenase E1 component alpha subunit
MLFASVIASPTLFIARNNGFAISTPSSEQYFGDGIAARGAGYGIDTVRVDGNDVLAVLSATRDARRRCVESGRGVLLEAMTYRYSPLRLLFVAILQISVRETYRVGHHSTSDDSFAYRPRQEVEDRKRIDNPIARYRLFLQNRGWWSDAEEEELKELLKKDVMRAFKHAEGLKRHELKEVFSDVYGGEEPLNLVGVPRSLPSPRCF